MFLPSIEKFYQDFPAYKNLVMFVQGEVDLKKVSRFLDEQEDKEFGRIKDFLQKNPDHNYCVSFKIQGQDYFIVNIINNFDWVGVVNWPLLKSPIHNEFDEFIIQHEIGHIVHNILVPRTDLFERMISIDEEGFDKIHFGEEFADTYGALKLLQAHGQEALPVIKRISDLRILFAVKHNSTNHATNNVLDKICEIYAQTDELNKIKRLSGQELAEMTLAFAKKHSNNSFDKQFQIDEWREAIFKPTITNWMNPKNKVLFDTVERQLDVPVHKVEAFIAQYDFEKGDLSDSFKRGVFMKIVTGINISLVQHDDMRAVQDFIEEGMLNRDAVLGGENRFPELAGYIRQKRGGFLGDRFAMRSAMCSPNFKSDLAEKYLGREAILRMAEFHQP